MLVLVQEQVEEIHMACEVSEHVNYVRNINRTKSLSFSLEMAK